MWKIILLFILLTPGILFTVPAFAKSRIGKMNLSSVCVHALIFVLALRWLGVTEGFMKPSSNLTKSSKIIDNELLIETNRLTDLESNIGRIDSAIADTKSKLDEAKEQLKVLNDSINIFSINLNVEEANKAYIYNDIEIVKDTITALKQAREYAIKREAAAAAAAARPKNTVRAKPPLLPLKPVSYVKGKAGAIINLGTKATCRGLLSSRTGTVVGLYERGPNQEVVDLDGANAKGFTATSCSIAEVSTGGSGSIISDILATVGVTVPGVADVAVPGVAVPGGEPSAAEDPARIAVFNRTGDRITVGMTVTCVSLTSGNPITGRVDRVFSTNDKANNVVYLEYMGSIEGVQALTCSVVNTGGSGPII